MDSEKCACEEYPTTVELKGIVKTVGVHCKGMMWRIAEMIELRRNVACEEKAWDRKQKNESYGIN